VENFVKGWKGEIFKGIPHPTLSHRGRGRFLKGKFLTAPLTLPCSWKKNLFY